MCRLPDQGRNKCEAGFLVKHKSATEIMNGNYVLVWFLFVTMILTGCKERFEPNLPSMPNGYLVVEGVINASGPTQIKLSRTTPLDQKQIFKPELGAQVKVEGDDNSTFALTGLANGIYVSGALPINQSTKYRVRIRTGDAKEYLSEFVNVKITPPIDSISWKEQDGGVQIYANTHDPTNNTLYYRWDYDETWEIHSAYYAFYRYVNGVIRPTISTDPQIYYCWKYDTSKTILLGSSAKLEQDIIYLNPLLFIPRGEERLGVRYSIQVRQYALNKEGYQFMEQMKKNTESLGTIFDPQPSALKGNVYSVSDPKEIVIGYINASTIEQKRIFISDADLSGQGFRIYRICESKDIPVDSVRFFIPPAHPYDAYSNPGTRYLISSPSCIDCRLRGGKNVKPDFW